VIVRAYESPSITHAPQAASRRIDPVRRIVAMAGGDA